MKDRNDTDPSSVKQFGSLPHSRVAEKAVLGAILQDPENLNIIADRVGLQGEHFFFEIHQTLFEVMSRLDIQNEPTDIITVAEALRNNEVDPDKLGPAYLVELTESAPFTENVEHHAAIVRNKFYLRHVIKTCQDTIQQATASEDDVAKVIENVEREFLKISGDQDDRGGLVLSKDILLPTLEGLEQRIASDGTITGVPSGFTDLDAFTGGWQSSDLIILAARPAMGKTALALNLAMNAVKSGNRVAIFTLEMSKEQLMERLLATEGRIDSTRLRKGDLTEEDQDRLMFAARAINENAEMFAIDETAGISLSEVRSRCRRFHKEHGLDLVVIDYLQLMSGSSASKKEGREREVSEISMGLKNLAKELHVPVISLAQLNRGPDQRPDKRPKISDLRESGSMEQDADIIMFVYRDEYYNPNSEDAGKAEVIIGKNRHGEVGTATLAYLPNFVSFHNLLKEN